MTWFIELFSLFISFGVCFFGFIVFKCELFIPQLALPTPARDPRCGVVFSALPLIPSLSFVSWFDSTSELRNEIHSCY